MNTSGSNTTGASRGNASGDNTSGDITIHPVRGPIALGLSFHFGLGLFIPEITNGKRK